jgi:phosphotransferase system enzyme I (PtsP)
MAPPEAIRKVVGEYIGLFSASGNPRLREKVQDVKDLGRRLIQNLRSDVQEGPDYRGVVVIATDLLPSDILKISAQGAEGLLMIGGGTTSHVSILARSLGLPVVVADDRRFFGLPADSTILLDGDQGNVFVNPPADVVKKFRELAESRRQADAYDEDECSDAVTACGERVEIMANINLLSEIAVARKMGACGIGLYRSEFPFIVRSDFPSEEEQCGIYRRILSDMEGRPVVFRTLDVGGDKMLSYFPNISEANPFLGLRAIRFSLRNKSIFSEQLRALLRAGAEADLRIMFPLVSSVDDFVEAREVVRECIQELAREGIPHCAAPKLGAMVELPSAVEVAGELADEADFLSIGSNDLVQYVLAVDRTNEHISDLYVSYHPAVLRAMSRVASAASQRGKPLSLCGEIAADPRMMSFLLGIGIRSLSVEVRHIRNVKKRVGQTRLDEARRQADHLLSLGRIRDVEAAIRG